MMAQSNRQAMVTFIMKYAQHTTSDDVTSDDEVCDAVDFYITHNISLREVCTGMSQPDWTVIDIGLRDIISQKRLRGK